MRLSRIVIAVPFAAAILAGCGDVNAALATLSEARRLAASLQVDFTHASDAANRAVMADTDAASVTYAREANAAKLRVHADIDALRPLLDSLGYTDEGTILQQFENHFAEYEKLDRQILDLAVENTNLKAQDLSFDAGQAAADAFRDALDAIGRGGDGDAWRRKATIETAVAAVRDIQALQAPHIAAPDDASMSRIEARMHADETSARRALAALPGLVESGGRSRVDAASAALDQFMEINGRILALSRRNTNVRSLALSLDDKRRVTPPCEQDLRALTDALARHGLPKGRWE